eukprot:574660-Heterocapsa_arctica.AAC.1
MNGRPRPCSTTAEGSGGEAGVGGSDISGAPLAEWELSFLDSEEPEVEAVSAQDGGPDALTDQEAG